MGISFGALIACAFYLPILSGRLAIARKTGPLDKRIVVNSAIEVTMVAVMNAQRVAPTATARTAKATRVAFAPSSLRGTAIRALPVRAVRKEISTVCKAVVSAL